MEAIDLLYFMLLVAACRQKPPLAIRLPVGLPVILIHSRTLVQAHRISKWCHAGVMTSWGEICPITRLLSLNIISWSWRSLLTASILLIALESITLPSSAVFLLLPLVLLWRDDSLVWRDSMHYITINNALYIYIYLQSIRRSNKGGHLHLQMFFSYHTTQLAD